MTRHLGFDRLIDASKPYAECHIYDSERGPRRRVQLACDSIQGRRVERGRG